jgi:hypothetical protein
VEIFGERLGKRLRKVERLDIARFAAEREDALQQHRATGDVAEDRVFGNRDQLQRIATL